MSLSASYGVICQQNTPCFACGRIVGRIKKTDTAGVDMIELIKIWGSFQVSIPVCRADLKEAEDLPLRHRLCLYPERAIRTHDRPSVGDGKPDLLPASQNTRRQMRS